MASAVSFVSVVNTFDTGLLYIQILPFSLSLDFRAWRDVIGLQAILACEECNKLAEGWERVMLFFHFCDLSVPT